MVMQQANNPPDISLIDRYLFGSITEAERELVENWLSDSHENRAILDALRVAVTSPLGIPPLYDRKSTVARVIDYSLKGEGGYRSNGFEKPERLIPKLSAELEGKRLGSFLPKATKAIMPAVFGVLMLFTGWLLRDSVIGSPISDGGVSVYTTGKGERATVTLLDGSKVVLNVASRLEVPANYGVRNRSLRLSGEAMFTVNHKSSSPFTVTAGDHTAKVLGTNFVVRHYPEDTSTLVAVREGRVSVKSSIINANQQVKVSRHGQPILSETTDGRFTFASSTLTIEGQEFINAVDDLERWYDVQIKFGDMELATRRIGGQFVAGSLSDLREILEVTFGFRVERSGRTLTLYSR